MSARKFLVPIDLTANELQNARIQNLASPPSSPVAGLIYFDTSLNAAYAYNGTAWVPTDATKATNIPNSALATNPLARANHTGTQASATISDLAATVQGYSLNQFATPTGNIAMGGNTLTGLGTPTAAGQAAEYAWVIGQVQSSAAGIASKPSVVAVAVANVALTGLPTVDGVTLTAGQRLLLTAQTTASQNGVWLVAAGAWTRANSDGSSELETGALWFVELGTTYGASQWRVATQGSIIPGTTNVSITQFNAATTYSASNGVQLVGNAFSAQVVASGGVLTGASGLQVDGSIVVKKYSTTIGDGSSLTYTVTHNLGSQDVVMSVRQAGSPFSVVEVDMAATTTNTCTITFASAPAASSYRVTVHA